MKVQSYNIDMKRKKFKSTCHKPAKLKLSAHHVKLWNRHGKVS